MYINTYKYQSIAECLQNFFLGSILLRDGWLGALYAKHFWQTLENFSASLSFFWAALYYTLGVGGNSKGESMSNSTSIGKK
jgi:hypothetical protein